MHNKIILLLSLPLTALLIWVSCVGLCTPGFYVAETAIWQAQAIGQDIFDLFVVVPCLLISSILAYRNNRNATMIWGGTTLYLTYTFVIYCFDVHFNKLFVLYCLTLGLSFYNSLYFLFIQYKEQTKEDFKTTIALRSIAAFFIILSVLFNILWLAEIIPSILHNTVPKSVAEGGSLTNAVHVIDLAVILPGFFITAVLLLKRKSLGLLLTPMFLSFSILMALSIGVLMVVMKLKGVEADLSVSAMMGILALIGFTLLLFFFQKPKTTTTL
ncbi:MAG: hypothetical protein V4651_11535 [Bacteroidota bacterium]